ncbi:MAG: hypothetical protein K2X49_24945 [Acetobacteraceae bacterium]|nr:hypothetical protein [Acetobacteraceae bacterium]
MALQLGALRDALREAGASDELARKASEEVAGYEHRFSGIEQKIEALDRKMDQRFAAVDAKMDQRFAAVDAKMDQRFAAVDAKMDQRFALIDQRFAVVNTRFAEAHGRINLLTWMVTFNLALTALVLGKLFGVIG